MSTQSVIHPVGQSKLTVVPFPAPQPITQIELALLLGMRGRLHQLAEQVEQAEQYIKTRLEKGALLEPGDHRAELKENFRRNVSWKDVVFSTPPNRHAASLSSSSKSETRGQGVQFLPARLRHLFAPCRRTDEDSEAREKRDERQRESG